MTGAIKGAILFRRYVVRSLASYALSVRKLRRDGMMQARKAELLLGPGHGIPTILSLDFDLELA
jgi:hypothetical protein